MSASFDAVEAEQSGESLDNVACKEIAPRLRVERVSPDFIYAFEKTDNLVTDENRDLWTAKACRAWDRALGEYRRRVEGDSKAIDLCFTLHRETGRTDYANKKRLAGSEFAIGVLCAHDQGLNSVPSPSKNFFGGLVGLPLAAQACFGECSRSYRPSAL